jgi:phage terminase large subunit-like protein
MATRKKTPTTSSARAPRKKISTPPAVKDKSGRDHVAIANKYIDDVLSGKILACAFVKAACARQKNDLERLKNHPIYVWEPDRGAKVCRFIERLPHIKGPKANAAELCVLEPWQCFIITTVFGWRRKTGGRRFKRAYTEVPRGNGKSFMSAGVGLFCLSNDGEQGAEVYSAATTKDQAKIVWGDARSMMLKRPDFAGKIGVSVSMYSIFATGTNSVFKPLSREADNQDGLNVHCAVIDELHAHKTRETYDVVETGSAKRTNSLVWVITTAGSDTSGICYEVRSYVKKILDGVVEDDTQFGIIYTIDEGDDWTDPAVWAKANPNWAVSVIPETFAALAFKAMQTPSAQNNFKTKHLNVWVNADTAAFDMRAWDKCGDANMKPEDFAGQEAFIGLDLASKIDIAAKAKLFVRRIPRTANAPLLPPDPSPPLDGGVVVEGPLAALTALGPPADQPKKPTLAEQKELHYYLFVDCYLPEAAITDGRNSQYAGWEIEGWLHTTPGDVLDFGAVKEDVLRDARDHRLRECGYDPWQTTQMAQELQAEGLTMVEVRPSVQNFSAPMKELDALMRDGRLHHNMNPIMRWMVSNTVCHTDAKDNIYPRKEKMENKIDGVVATLIALSRAMIAAPPVNKKPRIRVLGSHT